MLIVDLTRKSSTVIIDMIQQAEITPLKWDSTKCQLKDTVHRKTIERQCYNCFSSRNLFTPWELQRFKKKLVNWNTNEVLQTVPSQTAGIDKAELDWRIMSLEWMGCTWPADRKGSHKTMDCFEWIWKENGTAPFPKPKEYQKMMLGAYEQ